MTNVNSPDTPCEHNAMMFIESDRPYVTIKPLWQRPQCALVVVQVERLKLIVTISRAVFSSVQWKIAERNSYIVAMSMLAHSCMHSCCQDTLACQALREVNQTWRESICQRPFVMSPQRLSTLTS